MALIFIFALICCISNVSSEVVEGLTCKVIDPQKICFMDECPVSEGVCIRQDGGKYCCHFENLILPSLPDITTTVETTTVECRDLSPRCVIQSHLCGNSDYDKIMNVYCQKTCARECGPFTMAPTVPTCKDITPDCAGKLALCTMAQYVLTMKMYCARSCAFCT